MPIHDWTRVDHGTFHHFHVAWSVALYDALNEVLPPDYYAMVEQHAPPGKPDVLALRVAAGSPPGSGGGTSLRTVAVAPPRVHHRSRAADDYVADRKTVTVRHRSGGEIVALIEVASPGNKSSRHGLREFVDKVTAAIGRGLHVMVIDLFPPGPRDPNGFHPADLVRVPGGSLRPTDGQAADRGVVLRGGGAGGVRRAGRGRRPAAGHAPVPGTGRVRGGSAGAELHRHLEPFAAAPQSATRRVTSGHHSATVTVFTSV